MVIVRRGSGQRAGSTGTRATDAKPDHSPLVKDAWRSSPRSADVPYGSIGPLGPSLVREVSTRSHHDPIAGGAIPGAGQWEALEGHASHTGCREAQGGRANPTGPLAP